METELAKHRASLSPVPPPAQPEDAVADAVNSALVGGIWQSDSSQHTANASRSNLETSRFTVRAAPRDGKPTLRVAYFFSGIERKASIGNQLKQRCEAAGFGLDFEEIDIHVGGSAHDLLDRDRQNEYIEELESGVIDVQILSPPCASFSRAQWSNNLEPQPCRDRDHPWGFPNQNLAYQKRCDLGNEFVHFSSERWPQRARPTDAVTA